MLYNYIRISIRNLLKNRLFSAINIIGMAVSLASCLLIALFVWDEWMYDRHHPDGDRTYRVYIIRNDTDGATNYMPLVPIPFASFMQKDFPEIETTLRTMDTYGEQLFTLGDQKIMEKYGMYAEPTVFDMLTLDVIAGSRKDALSKPNTVALSRPLAEKYFGTGPAIGESIKIGNSECQVTAIFEAPPAHFHLKLAYIISLNTVTKNWTPQRFENWQNQSCFTYLKLKPSTDAQALEDKFFPFVKKYAYPQIEPQGFTYVPHLQNIKDIHLHSSHFEWEMAQRGSAQTVYILTFTAALLLIIACLNFINLSTSRSVRRMKEVGVRKVVGAMKWQLVFQFISESVMITVIALVLSLVIAEIALPGLNTFAEKNLVVPATPGFAALAISLAISLGVAAGSYPAFYLSRFRPATVLYHKSGTGRETAFLREGLVVVQFMFSFFLIIGSLIVLSQNDLIRSKDLGFTRSQLVMIPLRSKQLANPETTKHEFINNPSIESATIGFGIPGDLIAGDAVIDPTTHKNQPTNMFCIDYDFITTMKMHVVAGRDFSREFPGDEKHSFIINETAVKMFGMGSPDNAIGKPLDWQVWGKDSIKHGTVVGVVRDFHFKSLREQMTPVVMHIFPDAYWKLTVRIKPDNMPATLAHLKSTYERLDPEFPFTYKFVDENFDAMYRSEEKLSQLFSIFTALAIGVACLGLFGLVEYSVNQRAKEVSIRKVFGAGVPAILALLTRKYFLLVLIAFLVIIPISYYAAKEWLSNFAYHITVSPWLYAEACGLILLITALTVSFQSLRTAWLNPAVVLKNE